jgi:hypothetical protein
MPVHTKHIPAHAKTICESDPIYAAALKEQIGVKRFYAMMRGEGRFIGATHVCGSRERDVKTGRCVECLRIARRRKNQNRQQRKLATSKESA